MRQKQLILPFSAQDKLWSLQLHILQRVRSTCNDVSETTYGTVQRGFLVLIKEGAPEGGGGDGELTQQYKSTIMTFMYMYFGL